MSKIKFEIDKDKFSKIIRAQMYNTAKCNIGTLAGIFISLKGDVIRFVSTDGDKLLVTNINNAIKEKDDEFKQCVLNTDLLSKLKFVKFVGAKLTGFDFLHITVDDEKGMTIEDTANKITYNIDLIYGQCPKWEQLLSKNTGKKGYTSISINKEHLIKLLDGLVSNPSVKDVEIIFKNNNNLNHISLHSNYDDLETQALLMPMQIRRG